MGQLIIHYQRDLRGVQGNILSRVTTAKLRDAVLASLPPPVAQAPDTIQSVLNEIAYIQVHAEDVVLRKMLLDLPGRVEAYFEAYELGKALECISNCLIEVSHAPPLTPKSDRPKTVL